MNEAIKEFLFNEAVTWAQDADTFFKDYLYYSQFKNCQARAKADEHDMLVRVALSSFLWSLI